MFYKKRSLPLFFIYLVVALSGAASISSANAATACVWRVTNVPVPFYLVGTIHALKRD